MQRGQRGARNAPKRYLNKEQRQGHQKGYKKDPKRHENDTKKASKTEGKTTMNFSCFFAPFWGRGSTGGPMVQGGGRPPPPLIRPYHDQSKPIQTIGENQKKAEHRKKTERETKRKERHQCTPDAASAVAD